MLYIFDETVPHNRLNNTINVDGYKKSYPESEKWIFNKYNLIIVVVIIPSL